MTAVDVVPLVDEGLGNSAYLVDLGDGRALVVDVSRDLRAVRAAAEQRGLTVAFAADTHLHADFLSGAHQLAATDGARALASAAGHREYPHVGLHDGDEVDLGVILADADHDTAEIAWQAAKIGYCNIAGYLDGGMKAWIDSGHDVAALPLTTAGHLDSRRVLDVRQRAEYESGHLPGSVNIELGDIAGQAGRLLGEPIAVMCAHGERAMGAASLLEAAGHHDVVVIDGGADEWAQATGGQLATGS